jgi:hypothetical protein
MMPLSSKASRPSSAPKSHSITAPTALLAQMKIPSKRPSLPGRVTPCIFHPRCLLHRQKRRAQNRVAQCAYRDRRDQHVRTLETQFEEMAKQNEELTREHKALCCAHEKLKAEQEQWIVLELQLPCSSQ